jgi:pimeloyl-ACP methyl ester carboxylesterase
MVYFTEFEDIRGSLANVGHVALLGAIAATVSWLDQSQAFVWLLLGEVLFYVYESIRFHSITRSPNVRADTTRMRLAMNSFLELSDTVDFQEFIEGWFSVSNSSLEDIKHGNMVEFIAYGFYCKRADELSKQEEGEIEKFLAKVQKTFRREFPPGFNKDARFMGHTLEPVRSFHKPLVIYAFMELIGVINMFLLWCLGFQKVSSLSHKKSKGNMLIFVRNGQSQGKLLNGQKTPLVFIHGVGLGILPYFQFLGKLLQNIDRPCLVVEMRHVSMRLSLNFRSVSLETLANDIVNHMQAAGFAKGFFVSHSYGTFVVAKILQLRQDAVENVCLIDPVCCMTCHPKLTKNFVYRAYQGWPFASKRRFMDFVQLIFSRDLTIADTFCRHLNGMDVNLFEEDFPLGKGKHLLVLSGQDPLVPSSLIKEQFRQSSHIDVLYHDTHGHGDFLFDTKCLSYIVFELSSRLALTDDE